MISSEMRRPSTERSSSWHSGNALLRRKAWGAHRLAAGEAQHVLRQPAAHVHRAQDGLQRRLLGCRVAGLALDEVGTVADDAQQVVEVVGDAASQPSECLVTLALRGALLGLARARHRLVHAQLHLGMRAGQRLAGLAQRREDGVALADARVHGHDVAAGLQLGGSLLQGLHGARDAPCDEDGAACTQAQQEHRTNDQRQHRLAGAGIQRLARHGHHIAPAQWRRAEVAHNRVAIEAGRFEQRVAAAGEPLVHVGRGRTARHGGTARVAGHDGAPVVQHRGDPACGQVLLVDDGLQLLRQKDDAHVQLDLALAHDRLSDDRALAAVHRVAFQAADRTDVQQWQRRAQRRCQGRGRGGAGASVQQFPTRRAQLHPAAQAFHGTTRLALEIRQVGGRGLAGAVQHARQGQNAGHGDALAQLQVGDQGQRAGAVAQPALHGALLGQQALPDDPQQGGSGWQQQRRRQDEQA